MFAFVSKLEEGSFSWPESVTLFLGITFLQGSALIRQCNFGSASREKLSCEKVPKLELHKTGKVKLQREAR